MTDAFAMTQTLDFSILQNRFSEIKELYSSDKLKYIHIKSVDNFLFHADSLYMKHHKEEIYKTLNEYFDIIDSTQVDNPSDSLQLFNKYIMPLSNLYSDVKGFQPIFHLRTIIIWTVPIFILVFIKSWNILLCGTYRRCMFYFW
jgi:hypothetical protein